MSAKSLFSVRDFISTFHTPLTHDHKSAKLKKYFSATQCNKHGQQISLALRAKISIFSGFKEQLQLSLGRTCMSLLTDEQEQRGSSFN